MPKLNTESEQTVTQGDLRKGGNARTLLYSTVERFERLAEEKDALVADMKEVMDEAKGSGLDTRVIRTVIRRRKMDKADLVEADSMLDLYEETLAAAEKEAFDASVKAGG